MYTEKLSENTHRLLITVKNVFVDDLVQEILLLLQMLVQVKEFDFFVVKGSEKSKTFEEYDFVQMCESVFRYFMY